MAEEPLIKRKLLLDGDGTGEDKRLQVFIKQLTKWVYADESPGECEASYNALLAQLGTLELNRKKFDLSKRCTAKESEKIDIVQSSFKERTELVKRDIETQQNLLKRAKMVKKNHVEYDLLVQTVNQQPCRNELVKKIDSLNEELANLEKEKEDLGNKLNSKVKQCHVLSTSANAIKNNLREENTDWDVSSSNSETSQSDAQVVIVD